MPRKHPAPNLRNFISSQQLTALLRLAKEEDLGPPPSRDITSELMLPPRQTGSALFRARAPGTLCGAALLQAVVNSFDRTIKLHLHLHDGDELAHNSPIATVAGRLRSILTLERTALNLLCHLSGIATLTAQYVAAIQTLHPRLKMLPAVCDTRKTLPGLRALQKYAVACGGGTPHRAGLYDAVLIKDNHIAHIPTPTLPTAIVRALRQARSIKPRPKFFEIEVENITQLMVIFAMPPADHPDVILLDNMPPATLKKAVAMRNDLAPDIRLEASGGVTLATVRAIAATGVDRISIGALTHSAPALDIALDVA